MAIRIKMAISNAYIVKARPCLLLEGELGREEDGVASRVVCTPRAYIRVNFFHYM
jgi:hypothetical protein